MAINTRLKESDRAGTIKALHRILDNVPKFIEMPVRDKGIWANAWNSKIPQALFKAMDVCRDFGYPPNRYEQSVLRFTVNHEGKFYSTRINLDQLPGEPVPSPFKISEALRRTLPWDSYAEVKIPDGHGGTTGYRGFYLSNTELDEHLGDQREAFIEWIVSTSQLRVELIEAHQTIKDLFEMAKTAGQIKRMVPDLLQYLPKELQLAYANQIRASSLPFEWSPYPRDRVERMITAVGKGHLLAGMNKAHQSGWSVENLGEVMWGAEVEFCAVKPVDIVEDDD